MIITLEEHYLDPSWNRHRDGALHAAIPDIPFFRHMEDLAEARLASMDEAGIDVQVISHIPPGAQGVDRAGAVEWARGVNDRLASAVRRHPTRFAGFASLPTADPAAAADELQRCVQELGFKGAILHTMAEGPTLDEKRFWPIFARAEALDVPIYLHPGEPTRAMMETYYREYAQTHPMFVRAGWGFMVEAGTQAMRLILSGLFDAHPGLNMLLGHLGETIPYQLVRIDEALSRDTPMKNFREVFTRHFHVTTSGFFSDAALQCCLAELGADRILFSVDWPFASNKAGVEWLARTPLYDADREKISSGNARRLLKL